MAKEDVVATQKAAILSGQDAALESGLGAAFDAGEADGNGPGFTQADIDAAVAAAVDPLNAQIAADALALSDAQAAADASLAAVNQALADMTAKEQLEEQAVMALQSSVAAVQVSLDAIKALVLPAA